MSHNVCYCLNKAKPYQPTSDVVMLKCSTFMNDVNTFDVRLFFDRPRGFAYYTVTLNSSHVLTSCGFVSVRNACLEVRAFLRQMRCTSTKFHSPEYSI